MADIAQMETDVKEYKHQLETVASSLQVDPENQELQSLKTELEDLIALSEIEIAEKKRTAPARPAPKESRFKDNGIHKSAEYTEEPAGGTAAADTPLSFSINDSVLARWVSGDNAFYPAKITSITGSSTNPVYLVSFKSYGTVENLTAKDIRPISGTDSRKRKADGTPGSSASPSPAPLTPARNDPNKAGDGLARPAKMPRKVKANKELEAGKNKWQDFAAKAKVKSKGKFGKKESMFRTGEGLNARVGVTGSGQTMRKDPTRTRHVYQQAEDDGY
ncbi:hypothetical protein N7475_007018 [Penicillium sp. IBT 31633x]|nr:hypothetical protein N7475_007018 [Penicillium sp. IBT 31633x]